jgi:hypothetical protein
MSAHGRETVSAQCLARLWTPASGERAVSSTRSREEGKHT